jgi:hypothetical protein
MSDLDPIDTLLYITSGLNNYMELHSDEFEEVSGGCAEDDIITKFGFGFLADDNRLFHISYDDIEVCSIPIEDLNTTIQEGLTTEKIMNILDKCEPE